MSEEETPNNDLLDDSNKNAKIIVCDKCNSKILNSGAATFISSEHNLPFTRVSKEESADNLKGENLKNYWCVESIFGFENVGFSNTVQGTTKYLVCADCDTGPIGFHDTVTQKSFVALKRVRYC